MVTLETKIAGVVLSNCIYNASGPRCTSPKQLIELNESNSGAILTKSCTENMREGNRTPKYYSNEMGSLNSNGLENLGYKIYSNFPYSIDLKKPYIVSVSGMSVYENINILTELKDNERVSLIEFNLSCPNIIDKPQIAYDFTLMDEYLHIITHTYNRKFGIKLPPYFDPFQFDRAAEIINKYPLVKYVTCINSVGNALIIDTINETTVIHPKSGHGGLGGHYIKPIGLANIRQFSKRLRKDIDLIGVGGIYNGMDAFEYILCGASAVQVGTCYYEEGIECFERISNELKNIMREKSYKNIKDFKGKLIEI